MVSVVLLLVLHTSFSQLILVSLCLEPESCLGHQYYVNRV